MRFFFPQNVVDFGYLSYLLEGMDGRWALALMALAYVFVGLQAYLLGSINTAVIISKKCYGYDIRDYGSGNAGMTNMFRSFGTKAGLLTLAGDMAKALCAVVIAFLVLGGPGQYVAGFFCLIGHSFPLFHKFRGGKGIIVSGITILLIDPLVFLVLLLVWALMFFATKIISAASLTVAFFYPLVVYAFNMRTPSLTYILFSLFIGLFVIAMHRENIHRILNKTEKKFTIHKDDKKKKK